MTSPKIHYIVRHSEIVTNELGEKVLKKHTEKVFKNENPIIAREQAISYYINYKEGVDLYRKNYLKEEPEKQITEQIEDLGSDKDEAEKLLDPKEEKLNSLYKQIKKFDYSLFELYNKNTPHNDPAIYLVRDKVLLNNYEDVEELEWVIHQTITPQNDTYEVDEMMWNLGKEFEIYKKFNYETRGKETKVYYWSSEPYYENCDDQPWAEWYSIIKTPFNWSPYSKPNWWEDPEFYERHQRKLINEIIEDRRNQHDDLIKGGESETVEFKELLFSTILGKNKDGSLMKRNMQDEIAKVICSFLNKSGGSIFIGVSDSGKLKGVDLERHKNEDEYVRSFTSLKRRYFKNNTNIYYNYINGRFITVEGVRLFCIEVKMSEQTPTYLFNRENYSHEFYVREGTSSYKLYDAKDLLEYIEEKWWRKKYLN